MGQAGWTEPVPPRPPVVICAGLMIEGGFGEDGTSPPAFSLDLRAGHEKGRPNGAAFLNLVEDGAAGIRSGP